MPRLWLLLLVSLVALALPAGAGAAFFPADTIDGPSPDIVRLGGIDLARDGSGVAVYVKRVAGIEHVFAARMLAGRWQPPEQLDIGLAGPSGEPVVGVANGGQALVAFTSAGQLYTVVRRPSDKAWPAPVPLAAGAATPSIDESVNGVGYVVWASAGDVRAATLDRTARTWSPLDAPLDIAAADDAGTGAGRPQVAASADGTALAAWGESGHVYARRLFHTRQSTIPQELGVPALAGHPGGVADSPRVDIADDSSFAWVAFREAFDNGGSSRVLARRLVGSSFDPPADLGPGGFGGESTDSPALDVAGAGDAAFAAEGSGSHSPFGSLLYIDVLHPPVILGAGSAVAAAPQVAIGEGAQASLAWMTAPSASAPVAVHARGFKKAVAGDPETAISAPALGGVDAAGGFDAAADRSGDAVFGFVQGMGAGRRLVAGTWDRPPGFLSGTTTSHWRRALPLTWTAVTETWGAATYIVFVDGRRIGATTATRLPLAGLVADGQHRWRVVAADLRGQRSTSLTRTLRLDSVAPSIRLRISGARSAGTALHLVARVRDATSGAGRVRFDYGDGSPVVIGSDVHHAFRAGAFTVRVTAHDRAGNATVVTRVVHVG